MISKVKLILISIFFSLIYQPDHDNDPDLVKLKISTKN